MKKQKLSIVLGTVPKASSDMLSQEDVFYPGDVVTGMVTYNPTSNVKYCCVKIRFTGTVETKVSKIQDQVYVINQQSVLLGNANHENEYVLDEGEYSWPFEFTLPMQHIPSAGKYRHGSVKYTLVAILSSKGFLGGMQEQKSVKQINIRDLINCTAAPHVDPVQNSASFNLKPKTNKPKNVASATVQLGRSAFLPGQQLKVDIKFVHPAGHSRHPACWLQLIRKERYQAGENVKEYTHVVAQSCHAININREDKMGCLKSFLEIPKDCLYSTSTTKILTVHYHLLVLSDLRTKTGMFEGRNPSKVTKKLRAKLQSAPGGLETEIPITIGTLADVNHAPRVATVTALATSSTTSPSATASSLGIGSASPRTLTSGSAISVPTSSFGTSSASGAMTPTRELPALIAAPPPLKDDRSIHNASPKYTSQAELFQGVSSSSSSSSSSAAAPYATTGKGKRVEQTKSSGKGSPSTSTSGSPAASPLRSVGTSSFSLQPIFNALPDTHPLAATSGTVANGAPTVTDPVGLNKRRSSHPTLSASQYVPPLAHPAPPLTPAPHYHTLPSRQIQYTTSHDYQIPPSAAAHSTTAPLPLLPRFYTQPLPSLAPQPSQSSQPTQPSHTGQPAQPLQTSQPPLVPRFFSAGEPSHHSQQAHLPNPPQTNGSQGHSFAPPPAAVLSMRPLPPTPRPSFSSSHSGGSPLSVPLVAAPGRSVDPHSPMTPPRPPPKPVAGPSQMTAHSQPGPHNPNYHYVSTGSRAGPGAYGRQGHSLPRMSSTPDITRSYAYSAYSGGHYPADHKLPPSPAPITIEPPFYVAMAHRESPTAPRAIDLGYGPASPAIDGPAGGMVRPPTPRSSFSSPAIVFPTMASPAPYGSLASPPRHQPPVGDYFTVTSLAPAPAPAMIPLATNMTMAPASAPRFSLVFGTSSSTAPSTQAGMAAASMSTAAAAAATTPAAPLAMVTGNAGQAGMMVLSPSHDGGDGGVAPPYAPSAANGHRTL